MRPYAKKSLAYFICLTLFVFAILFAKDLIFTQAYGSSSGTVTATVTVNPITIDIRARPPSPFVDREFTVQATVENLGSLTLNEVAATIFLPAGLTLLSDQSQFLDSIAGGRKKRVSWDVQTNQAGQYIIIVEISAIDSGTGAPVFNEASLIVEVRDKPGRNISTFFDFWLNLFRSF